MGIRFPRSPPASSQSRWSASWFSILLISTLRKAPGWQRVEGCNRCTRQPGGSRGTKRNSTWMQILDEIYISLAPACSRRLYFLLSAFVRSVLACKDGPGLLVPYSVGCPRVVRCACKIKSISVSYLWEMQVEEIHTVKRYISIPIQMQMAWGFRHIIQCIRRSSP